MLPCSSRKEFLETHTLIYKALKYEVRSKFYAQLLQSSYLRYTGPKTVFLKIV